MKLGDNENLFFNMANNSKRFQKIWDDMNEITKGLTIHNIEETLHRLKEIDNVILTSDLAYCEKDAILQSNSVARFSSAYWVAEKTDPNSPWIKMSEERGGEFAKQDPPEWVYTDIKSAYIGALFTWNPFSALAAAACSVVDAVIEYKKEKK